MRLAEIKELETIIEFYRYEFHPIKCFFFLWNTNDGYTGKRMKLYTYEMISITKQNLIKDKYQWHEVMIELIYFKE